jgi:phytoene dehydrogenase-like protein
MKIIKTLTLVALMCGIKLVAAQCGDQSFLVIGAGVAGLGAAKNLKDYGCKVTVLEARPRIGGRISTEVMGTNGIKVDMGASWIHGIGPGAGDLEEY